MKMDMRHLFSFLLTMKSVFYAVRAVVLLAMSYSVAQTGRRARLSVCGDTFALTATEKHTRNGKRNYMRRGNAYLKKYIRTKSLLR